VVHVDAGIELYILQLKAKNLELKEIEEKTMDHYACSRKTFYNYWKKVKGLSEEEMKKKLDEKVSDGFMFDGS
jgi:hypothetical protein